MKQIKHTERPVALRLQKTTAKVADVPGASSILGDPWIKTGNEFTEHEKVRSENKGRYCQADWFVDRD